MPCMTTIGLISTVCFGTSDEQMRSHRTLPGHAVRRFCAAAPDPALPGEPSIDRPESCERVSLERKYRDFRQGKWPVSNRGHSRLAGRVTDGIFGEVFHELFKR